MFLGCARVPVRSSGFGKVKKNDSSMGDESVISRGGERRGIMEIARRPDGSRPMVTREGERGIHVPPRNETKGKKKRKEAPSSSLLTASSSRPPAPVPPYRVSHCDPSTVSARRVLKPIRIVAWRA